MLLFCGIICHGSTSFVLICDVKDMTYYAAFCGIICHGSTSFVLICDVKDMTYCVFLHHNMSWQTIGREYVYRRMTV